MAEPTDMYWYQSIPDKRKHGEILQEIATVLLQEAVFQGTQRSEAVIQWRTPSEINDELQLRPEENPASHNEILEAIKTVIKLSTKTGHPFFMNQLFSGLDPYGLAGQWTTDALNPSSYTYEVAPVFTLMEEVVLEEMRRLVGFPQDQGDGVFCAGGSIANGYGINLARFKAFRSVKTEGLHGLPQLVLFTSEDAHYSVHKMAAFMGLGEAAVRTVKVDAEGRMDTKCLERGIESALAEGLKPFLVFATAGTTVLGAFDPLLELSRISDQHNLWLHVDAAWGGGLLFSKTYRHLLRGIEKADSVAWNPHKLLAVPQQCSVLLVRQAGLLTECHQRRATYLFQNDKFYDSSLDPGDKYIQCGRRVDVFKFWLMWKAKGSLGFERHVDWLMELKDHLLKELRNRSDRFRLVLPTPAFINVGFWYIPPRLRGLENASEYTSQLHAIAPQLKEILIRLGCLMINYQPLRELPNFFRFVVQNSGVTREDVSHMLDMLEEHGARL